MQLLEKSTFEAPHQGSGVAGNVVAAYCEDRVLDGPASGEKGSKSRTRSSLMSRALTSGEHPATLERTGDTNKGFKVLHLKAKARIWP